MLVGPGVVEGVAVPVLEVAEGTEDGETVVVELGTLTEVLEPLVAADGDIAPTGETLGFVTPNLPFSLKIHRLFFASISRTL